MLVEVADLLSGGTPNKSSSEMWSGPVPWVSPKDMDQWLLMNATDHVSEAAVGKGTRLAPQGATLVVVRSMALASKIQMAYLMRSVAFNQDLKAIVPKPGVNARYLFYVMAAARDRLLSAVDEASHGTKRIQTHVLESLEVPMPLPEVQAGIAEVLGALDDKIDLNRRMNQTAKELLRAAFSQMPNGDESARIGDMATIVGGSTPSTGSPDYWSHGQHAWATPKDLAGIPDPVLTGTARRITDAGLAQISSRLLPEGTVLLSSRAPIGYLAVSAIPVAVNQGFIAMIPNGKASSYFLLQWAASHMDDIKARANGTTFQEISKANFRPIPVNLPSPGDMDRFDEIAAPLHALMVSNVRENEILAQLRDALLPELISGRITVKEAAAAV